MLIKLEILQKKVKKEKLAAPGLEPAPYTLYIELNALTN